MSLNGRSKSNVVVSANRRIKDPLLRADLASETYVGATNASTALGNGRLTVGVSPWGEITYLRWPRASYYDHLRYFTFSNSQSIIDMLVSAFRRPRPVRMDESAPSQDFRRYGRPYEPYPQLGSRAGVMTGEGIVSWLDEFTWSAKQSYSVDISPVLETRLQHISTELKVLDWVDPNRDLMVRNFKLGKNIRRFFYHGTFQPLTAHPSSRHILYPLLPDPPDAGFGAVYLKDEDVVAHFRPWNPRIDEKVRASLQNGCSAAELDFLFPEGGVFLIWGFDEGSDGVQVGADRSGRKVKKDAPLGGWVDAQDGRLEGNKAFIGPVDASLSRNVSPEENVKVLIALARSAENAIDVFCEAKDRPSDDLRDQAEKWWRKISDKVHVPEAANYITKRVAKRSIINLFIGRDRESGAIVASPSRQPAYHFDWPRDGAFFDLALDLAGFPEVVDDHLKFYVDTQRKGRLDVNLSWILGFRFPFYRPVGHWSPNIASDGEPGYLQTIIPLEIDETSLLIWDFWRHEQFLTHDKRQEYRDHFKNTLENAADSLLRHVNINEGKVKRTSEDDYWRPISTLHGAASVLTGLCSAIDAGGHWDIREAKVMRWRAAAQSLKMGILKSIEKGEALENLGWRGLSWAIWPAPIFDTTRDPLARVLIGLLEEEVREKIQGQRLGCAYLGEQVCMLALALRDLPGKCEFLEDALEELTQEMPFPGTDCFGEVVLRGDFAGTGKPVYQNRTSIPHLWNGVTVYLAALALHEPELFDELRPPAPD